VQGCDHRLLISYNPRKTGSSISQLDQDSKSLSFGGLKIDDRLRLRGLFSLLTDLGEPLGGIHKALGCFYS